MTAVRKIIKFPSRPQRRRDYETAFLPAALEVVETPPSPIGRAIGVTIILLFCAALAWASLGKVDVVATAPGKIVLNGRTKVIQPAETGVVRAINVRDGEAVKAGDVLIELDPTINAAELDHVKSDLIAAGLDIARLRAALAADVDPAADFTPPEGASAEGRGTRDNRCDDRQARRNDPAAAGAGEHAQISLRQGDRLQDHLSHRVSGPCRPAA